MSSKRVSLPGTPTLATPLSSTSTTTQVNDALYSAQVQAANSAFQVVAARHRQVQELQNQVLDDLDDFLSEVTDAELGIPPPSPPVSPTADLDAVLATMTDADLGIPPPVDFLPTGFLTPVQYGADWSWAHGGYVPLPHFAHLLPAHPQFFEATLIKKDGSSRPTAGLALGMADGMSLMRVLDLRQKTDGTICGMIKHFCWDLQAGVTFHPLEYDPATRMPLSAKPARPQDRFA